MGCEDDSGKDKAIGDGKANELLCKQVAEMRWMERPIKVKPSKHGEAPVLENHPQGLEVATGDDRKSASHIDLQGIARDQPGVQ